jgi:hypothetical protein
VPDAVKDRVTSLTTREGAGSNPTWSRFSSELLETGGQWLSG